MGDALRDKSAAKSRPRMRRRWLSYSLRGLFLIVFAAAIGSWWTRTKLDQFAAEHEAIEHLRSAGGKIGTVPAAPQWFWKLFPKEISQQCEYAFHADLHPMQTTDADMALIGRLTRLETLIIRSKLVSDEGCAHCRGLTRLRSLSLYGSPSVTSVGIEQFLGAKRLDYLQIGGAKIGDKEMDLVVRFHGLTVLFLAPSQIGDPGLRRITALKGLQRLDLPRTVSRRGLRDLSELPNLCNLRCWIESTDDGPVFDSVARLEQLVQLDIWGNGLTDADLAQIAKAPRLEHLDIRGGSVSETGLLALKTAPKLRAVSVYEPWFPAGTQQRLAKQLAPISVGVSERSRGEGQPDTRKESPQQVTRELEGRGALSAEQRDQVPQRAAGETEELGVGERRGGSVEPAADKER